MCASVTNHNAMRYQTSSWWHDDDIDENQAKPKMPQHYTIMSDFIITSVSKHSVIPSSSLSDIKSCFFNSFDSSYTSKLSSDLTSVSKYSPIATSTLSNGYSVFNLLLTWLFHEVILNVSVVVFSLLLCIYLVCIQAFDLCEQT